jgi:predicted unusual protein kinase regulating ubiquinone biosynthesis (AarF/ABC1/UbiB family)
VLLDLGAVERVDETMRADLGRLVRALALGRKRALADAVLALSPNGSTVSVDRARLESELSQLVDDASGKADGARVLQQMVALGRTHQLRLSPSLLALVRALALLDGVLRGLDPARDLVADLRREWILSFGRRMRGWWRRAFGSVTDLARRWRAPQSPAPLLLLPWMHLIPAPETPPRPQPPGSSRPPST